MSSAEKRYESTKAQGLLKEYGDFLQRTIDELCKEYDVPITGETAEQIGLQYTKHSSAQLALKGLITRLNKKANEH